MRKIFFLLWVFFSVKASSQIPKSSAWMGLQVPVQINTKWQWHHDAGYRTLGFSASAQQLLYRTGIRYLANKQVNIAAGPAFFFTRTTFEKLNHKFGKEFRLWEEVSLQSQLSGRSVLQNRFRVEQRWFQQTNSYDAYFAFRFRYRLAYTFQFSKKWGVQLSDEYMRQVSDQKFSFNQNRSNASVFLFVNDITQFQAGYMWLKRPEFSQHILVINYQQKFNF